MPKLLESTTLLSCVGSKSMFWLILRNMVVQMTKVYALAHGPVVNLATYQSYDINGYTFCTEEQDKKSDYLNSGVTMESMNGDGVLERFYGRLEEIWELEYSGKYNVTMFRVRWARSVERENRDFTTLCIPDAKRGTVNVTAKNEPWVHSKHVTQCFFMTDQTTPA